MTIYGWDTSHYDGPISAAVARAAYQEGIRFATAKVGEGGTYDDPLDGPNLAALREAGVPFLGGYYVPRTPGAPIADQVAHCISLADRDMPWWRTWSNTAAGTRWWWQVDLELWGYDDVSVATGTSFGRALAAETGHVVALYASHGQYGDKLLGWTAADGPLWNANYPSSRQAPFKDLYPGDSYAGWAPYAGRTPDLCQYASSATIGGLTTCDANAFRGTLADLAALLTPSGGTVTLAQPTAAEIQSAVWHTAGSTGGTESAGTALGAVRRDTSGMVATLAGIVKTEAAIQATLAAIAAGGTSVDTAALAAQIKAVGDAESAAVAGLHDQIADLTSRLVAAEQAAADALAAK